MFLSPRRPVFAPLVAPLPLAHANACGWCLVSCCRDVAVIVVVVCSCCSLFVVVLSSAGAPRIRFVLGCPVACSLLLLLLLSIVVTPVQSEPVHVCHTSAVVCLFVVVCCRQAVGGGEGAHPSANPGLNRWFGVLRQLSLPADSDSACASLLGHISEIETSIAAFLATVNTYSQLAAQMATVVTDMHVCVVVVEAVTGII